MWGDGKMTWPSGEDTVPLLVARADWPAAHDGPCSLVGCQEYIGSLKKGVFHGKDAAGMIALE